MALLYLYPRCHFRASKSPECTPATLLRRGKVTPALCQHGGGVFISAVLLKRRCDVLFSPAQGRGLGVLLFAGFGSTEREKGGSVNGVVRRSSGSGQACRIAVDTGRNDPDISRPAGGGLFEGQTDRASLSNRGRLSGCDIRGAELRFGTRRCPLNGLPSPSVIPNVTEKQSRVHYTSA